MPMIDCRARLALLVAGTFFMENLDATVITPAIPAMAHSFAVLPVDLNAGVSVYMLTLGVLIPISGWAAERFGARCVFSVAIALFTIASLLCGLSESLLQFVITRILQGIGGALMVPVGRLVVLRETPKKELIRAIAVLTWPALVAPVLGPPLGGLIADHGNWRWIFWLNLPLGVIAFLLAWWIVPALKPDREKSFDWPGFLLTGGGLFGLMTATEILSRTEAAWDESVLPLVVGLVLMGMGVVHLKRAARPMFNLGALAFPTFAVAICGGSLFRLGVSAIPFLIPLMFQLGFGFDAFSAGAMLMAVFAGNLAMKPMTTWVMRRFGFRQVLVINGLLNATLIGICALFSSQIPLWLICVVLFLGGMARSMQFTALNTIAFSDVPQAQMSDANTLFSMAIQLAMGLGVALGAIAWRIGQAVLPHAGVEMPFRIAFLVVAMTALLAVVDSARLKPGAGDHVAKDKS
ncbi:MFS transporter [Martelella alba]|uniref:MFS transporter n=1 Tax=Martelella alba TaxID=2590451 RepID=A0ABY2SGT1_9HYPH|nr:MFS transporter [Martelella alba]TKI03741.1 MFS transporter [Martelella alba]